MPLSTETEPATVLVVDDDALILMTAVTTVEDAGFRAISACDAAEAMRALLRHPQIAGLFTDINMPGAMDGLALAHETRRLWPGIHILIVSGASHPLAADMPARGQYLRKPYTSEEVAARLQGLLG